MNKNPDVSIIIVSYNTSDLTLKCLKSIQKSTWGILTKEITVVDNGSTDGTVETIKKELFDVTVIENKTNNGFAAGNNQGIRKAHGRYILLLNSDTEVYPDTIRRMTAFMDAHKNAGVSTCKLVMPDGRMDPACHRGFPTPWNAFTYYTKLEKLFPKTKIFAGYHQGHKDLSVPHEVDSISGAFFMIRKEVIGEVGMLDESYFMYAEDIDWAFRIKESGWQIWFNPDIKVLHVKKQSGRSHNERITRIQSHQYFLKNNKLFYTKHYEKRFSRVTTILVYLAYDFQLWLLNTFGIIL